VHAPDATVADVSIGPGYQLLDQLLVLAAERAQQGARTRVAGPPASAPSACFHDLVDALVTQAKLVGDLPQRPASQLEPAYRPVEFGAESLRVMLSIDEASFRGFRLSQQAPV
jgi:hypothetical protein